MRAEVTGCVSAMPKMVTKADKCGLIHFRNYGVEGADIERTLRTSYAACLREYTERSHWFYNLHPESAERKAAVEKSVHHGVKTLLAVIYVDGAGEFLYKGGFGFIVADHRSTAECVNAMTLNLLVQDQDPKSDSEMNKYIAFTVNCQESIDPRHLIPFDQLRENWPVIISTAERIKKEAWRDIWKFYEKVSSEVVVEY